MDLYNLDNPCDYMACFFNSEMAGWKRRGEENTYV